MLSRIHLLTHPSQLTASAVVCGDPHAAVATWDEQRVTCPACKPEAGLRGARQPGGMSERALQEQIRQAARAAGFLTYHPYRSTRSEPGWVDLVLAKSGHPLFLIEVKTERGVLTPHQQEWFRVLSTLQTVEAHVCRPHTLQDIVERLSLS